jgi:hypothetical protein
MDSPSADKTYLFDNPRNVKRLMRGLYIACGLLVALDFVIHRHILHSWERIPAFYALYGFVGCVLLVVVAKWMRTILMRPTDYYETDTAADEHAAPNPQEHP